MGRLPRTDWNDYARERILGRNRLLLEHHQEVLQDFLSFFSTVDIESCILDIGSASGFFLAILRELGFKNVEGVDASETFVARAREKGLRCRVMDISETVPEGNEKRYDFVLLLDVLEHLDEPVKAMENAANFFLKADGKLFITVPIYDSISEKWKRLRWRRSRLEQSRAHDPTHVQAFSEKEMRALVESAGLGVVSSKRLYCPLPFIPGGPLRGALNALLPGGLKGMFLRVVASRSAGRRS